MFNDFDGEIKSIDQVYKDIKSFDIECVEFTGGEPLLQPNVYSLIEKLCDEDFKVLIETSGTISVRDVDKRAHVILDFKTPGSFEHGRNHLKNIEYIMPHWQIKFVICNQRDFEFAMNIVNQYDLLNKCHVLFSASYKQLSLAQLSKWVLATKKQIRVQAQLHKIIWGDQKGT